MATKPNAVRQCDPECIFVWLSSGMEKIEELKSADDRDPVAIAKAIEEVRETIADIEMQLTWYNVKLNRLEIENTEYDL